MKDGVREVIGKRILSVIVSKTQRCAGEQLFLIFDDGTYFEIWGESFNCAGGVDSGGADAAIKYANRAGSVVSAIYP